MGAGRGGEAGGVGRGGPGAEARAVKYSTRSKPLLWAGARAGRLLVSAEWLTLNAALAHADRRGGGALPAAGGRQPTS